MTAIKRFNELFEDDHVPTGPKGRFEEYTNSKGDRFWGDMGAGILPICTETGRILLAMRSPDVNEPNTWGIIGGALEEGETDPLESAKRELKEESGYKGHFEVVPSYVYESPNKTFKYYNYIGLLEKEFKPKLDWETAYTEWMTLEQFMEAKPKHFGLKALIEKDLDLIKKYAK